LRRHWSAGRAGKVSPRRRRGYQTDRDRAPLRLI